MEKNIVKTIQTEGAHIQICDDFCRNTTAQETEKILNKIAADAILPLSAQSVKAKHYKA